MGLLPLTYRRPSHVDRPSMESRQDGRDVSLHSGRSGLAAGIPPALSFDNILEGGTCPPCTIRDFMNYLIYIERSAENLQFFLWFRDYTTRFESAPEPERLLAPEWTAANEEQAVAQIQKEALSKLRRGPQPAADIFKGTDFEKAGPKESLTSSTDPFSTPPQTPRNWDQDSQHTGSHWGSGSVAAYTHGHTGSDAATTVSNASTYRTLANEAYVSAGAYQPFTVQPFREEIDRVIATYIMDRSPRQLNLSAKEQKALLHALSTTTHPSAFRSVAASIESSLRHQAHPNFIRWSICNGNPARVTFARGLGVVTILLSTVLAVLLALSRAPRGYRALAAVGWVIGVATLVAAAKGMCVVLHGMHHRHVRPWELFVADEEQEEVEELESEKAGSRAGRRYLDAFGGRNSYEEEPWVVRYRKRNLVRKVFDREVWIQEPMLRQIQDTIFVQSLLCGVVVSAIAAGVFVAVPAGRFF